MGTAVDRLVDEGASVFFGETSELTGGEHLIAERMATPELREKFTGIYDAYVTTSYVKNAFAPEGSP